MARCSVHNTARNLARSVISKPRVSLRPFSASVNVTAEVQNQATQPHQEPLTILHKTSKILPKALEFGSAGISKPHSLTVKTWESILSNAYEALSSARERPIQLVVYGIDEWAGANDLVTALVANPLNSNEAQSETLRDRWKGNPAQTLTISYGADVSLESNTIRLQSPFLQQFPVPVEITELRTGASPKGHFTTDLALDSSTLETLFEADIPIIVCNPITTSLASLLSTPLPTKTIVVLTSSPSQPIDINQVLSNVPSSTSKPTFIIADPRRASNAIHLLQSSSLSSSVVQKFQDDFTGSNVSAVAHSLQALLSASESRPSMTTQHIRTKFALSRLQDTLSACLTSIEQAKILLNAASVDASRLNDRFQEAEARAEVDFLGPTSQSQSHTGKSRGNEVTQALELAEKQMQEVMGRLTWWRMVWRVDEITSLVTAALQRTWCPELERKLLVHTGQLACLQTELSKAAFDLLSQHGCLQTNVLRNTLLQLESSPQHQLTTASLTSPISSRRDQIVEYPTARLHLAGQRAVLGMMGGVLGGAGIGWFGWVGGLIGGGGGLLGFVGLEPSTAVALGTLSAVASVRWAVGNWERGKKKWWDDWWRVGEGLDRDLRATLHQTLQQQIGGVPRASSSGLLALIKRQEEEIEKLGDEVKHLQLALTSIIDRSK